MNIKIPFVGGAIAALLLSGCSSNGPTKEERFANPYPDWVMLPSEAASGLSAASCVAIPAGNMNIARKKALADAKAEIAAQINTRVQSMDKVYDRLANSDEGASVGGTFESASKQIVLQSLSGARMVKFERVMVDGKSELCALVNMDPTATEKLISGIISSVEKTNLSSANESILREGFFASKAHQELDAEIDKLK